MSRVLGRKARWNYYDHSAYSSIPWGLSRLAGSHLSSHSEYVVVFSVLGVHDLY